MFLKIVIVHETNYLPVTPDLFRGPPFLMCAYRFVCGAVDPGTSPG